VVDPKRADHLILGPFQGQVACQTIAFGKGVCGAAAESGKTQLVSDVEEFPGHIACDANSKSEIVIPILQDGKVRSYEHRLREPNSNEQQVMAIIDIDCAELNGFDESDQRALEELASLIAGACEF